MLGQLEGTSATPADLNEVDKLEKSSFAIGVEQAQLSMGEGIEDEAYTKIISGFEDYRGNEQYYDAWKNVSTESAWNLLGKGINDVRYRSIVTDDMFKLDENDNVVRGSKGFFGAELLYDMDAVKGMLLANKNGFDELALKTAYSEITQTKSQELALQAEGKSIVGRVGGIIAGHLAQPQTLAEVAMSPHRVMGQTILGGMAKAAGIETLVVIPGEISREQRTKQHMEAAGLEYGLWDSVQNVLINSGLGGLIRGAGSGIVDANTVRQINKRIVDPTDKTIVNRFFQREAYRLTNDTNKHIALVQKSLNDMNENKAVDVSQHTDIDINAKTDPEIEEISLDAELTKKDMANGYQDEVQSFENDYAKAGPIPEESYMGDIRPDQDLDTYAGMATKEEGDELIKEMAELDPEIKAELEELQAEMKGDVAKEAPEFSVEKFEKQSAEEQIETIKTLDEEDIKKVIPFVRPETVGALLGFEQDEETNEWSYNLVKGALGAIGARYANKAISSGKLMELIKQDDNILKTSLLLTTGAVLATQDNQDKEEVE